MTRNMSRKISLLRDCLTNTKGLNELTFYLFIGVVQHIDILFYNICWDNS